MGTDTTPKSLIALSFEQSGKIAVVKLTDPARGNAMSPEMGRQFKETVSQLNDNKELRAVVITGEGKDFSIGGHRDMLQSLGDGSRSPEQLRTHMMGFYDAWLSVTSLQVPIISVIQGACIGVAPVFACISDITVAEADASFQITFASLGLYPGMGMPYLVPRTIGPQRASWLLLSGQTINGVKAAEIGLAAVSAPHGEGLKAGLAIASDIAANAAETVRLLLKHLRLDRASLNGVLEENAVQQAKDFQTEEYRQRIAHYLEDYYA